MGEQESARPLPLCREPWESFYILRRGVLPCCHGHKAIAPMTEWKSAWNSPALVEIREHLARGELSPYCRKSLACPIVQRVMAGEGKTPPRPGLRGSLKNVLRRLVRRGRDQSGAVRGRTVVLLLVLLILVGSAATIGMNVLRNVHTFADGEGVRTARLNVSTLRETLTERKIQSVLCLMGEPDDLPWYDEEALCGELGVSFHALEASSEELPSVRLVQDLVDAWETMPRPILVHCRRGADRTGLTVAMIEMLRGTDPEKALDEHLTWTRLHLCDRETCQLHRFFSLYQEYLDGQAAAHTPELFRSWCLETYYPPPYSRAVEVLSFPETARTGEICTARFRVTNTSGEPWATSSDQSEGTRFGGRVLGPLRGFPDRGDLTLERYFHEHRLSARFGFRILTPDGSWESGETREMDCVFPAGEEPGTYLYRLDMIEEHVTWFSVRSTPATYRFFEVVDEP